MVHFFRSPFNETLFFLFSVMDDKYEQKMLNYTQAKMEYALRFGYQFVHNLSYFHINVSAHHPTSLRIYALDALLMGTSDYGGPKMEWIVYIDSDAFVAEQHSPLTVLVDASERFRLSFPKDDRPCFVITQDCHGFVNSGFWMIKNTSFTRNFVRRWKDSFEYSERNGYLHAWLEDQGAMLNAMLHVAANDTGHSYNNDCFERPTSHRSNMCFNEKMTSWSYPQGRRKFAHICLLPEIGVPFQHHTHYMLGPGEMIWHKKGLSRIDMTNSGYFHYNYTNKKQVLRNNSFLKKFGSMHKRIYIYLDDNRKHAIPNLDTLELLKMSLNKSRFMANIVSLAPEDFDSIEEGDMIERVASREDSTKRVLPKFS